MSWASEEQLRAVAAALCRRARCPELAAAWEDDDAPTVHAWLEAREGSTSQRVLVSVGWACWNMGNPGGVHLGDLFALDGPNMRSVAALLSAYTGGPSAVAAWLQAEETGAAAPAPPPVRLGACNLTRPHGSEALRCDRPHGHAGDHEAEDRAGNRWTWRPARPRDL